MLSPCSRCTRRLQIERGMTSEKKVRKEGVFKESVPQSEKTMWRVSKKNGLNGNEKKAEQAWGKEERQEEKWTKKWLLDNKTGSQPSISWVTDSLRLGAGMPASISCFGWSRFQSQVSVDNAYKFYITHPGLLNKLITFSALYRTLALQLCTIASHLYSNISTYCVISVSPALLIILLLG